MFTETVLCTACVSLVLNKAQCIRVLRQNDDSCASSTMRMHCFTLVNAQRRLPQKRRSCWIKSLSLFSLCTKSILVALKNLSWTTCLTWTLLTMSLPPFWALNVSVALLSMQGQKALGFHQKYELSSYGFGTTQGWVINDRISFLGELTLIFMPCSQILEKS